MKRNRPETMSNLFSQISLNKIKSISDQELYLERLKEQIPLHGDLELLFEEIELASDIFYLSYNSIRESKLSVKVSEGQFLLHNLIYGLSFDMKILSEGFSKVLQVTGTSYNSLEDFKKILRYVIEKLRKVNTDELSNLLKEKADDSNAEASVKVQQVFELLELTIKNLSTHITIFYDRIEVLGDDYCGMEHMNTNLKVNSSEEQDSLAFKFNIYTLCIDAILRKYHTTSIRASQKISEQIGKKHLTVVQANEQLAQLEEALKQKWVSKFRK